VKRVDATTRIVAHPHNLGKGAAVRTGMLAAQGDWRYLCDADLSAPINEIDHFLAETNHADIIIGSRAVAGADIQQRQARWKVWLGKSGNLLVRLLAVRGIKDSQCGFKLYSVRTMRIFEQQRINRWGYDFENLFLARKYGWRIKEIPVKWKNDARSKVKPLDYFRTLYELFTIRLNDWRGLYQKP
jgi:dolichyl-phosphate beta-glucosyltransferase